MKSLRMLPPRRRTILSPRYLLTWQCRRFSTLSTPHLWTLPWRRSHTVLCLSTFLHRWVLAQLPRFLLMCLFRLLYAVLCYTMFPHNYRSRSSLSVVSSLTVLLTVKARHRHKAILVVPHRLNLMTLLRLAVSAVPVLTETVTCTLRPHVSCSVNPNLMGTVTLTQPTVISCIINIVFPSFNGIQARRAEILLTLSLLPVVSFMQLFFKKPVIAFRTSLNSSLCALATRTLLSCSVKTLLSLTLQSSHTRLTPQAKVRGAWFLLIVRGLLRRPSLSGSSTVTFCSVHIHNVVAKKRDASTELLQFLHAKKNGNTMSTSLVVTST